MAKTAQPAAKGSKAAKGKPGIALGARPGNDWRVSAKLADMTRPPRPLKAARLAAQFKDVVIDWNKSALIVIDMQNDFCHPQGWLAGIGVDVTPARAPIKPLAKLLPKLRKAGVPVLWVNWGNRPDLANMPPNQHHLYKPKGVGIGLGEPLPGHGAHVLEKDSWAAAIVDELPIAATDIRVDKHRISGFWDTPLDSILRNVGVRSILFAGCNTDQCVLHTLTDANFLGYGCVLLDDCCATTSPAFCTEATLWNVRKCYGFVADSQAVLDALKTQ